MLVGLRAEPEAFRARQETVSRHARQGGFVGRRGHAVQELLDRRDNAPGWRTTGSRRPYERLHEAAPARAVRRGGGEHPPKLLEMLRHRHGNADDAVLAGELTEVGELVLARNELRFRQRERRTADDGALEIG